ncbi:hypothetical protein [Herminiimonas contaminans]|uniref:Uncharacterized protein n=1 Tax=Herminiimonas contaminans TaxID=1111140 RepID=A0ABS0ET77_9BURK|nr:hypothetical protein [Herminiimonas contaminans]MBF8178042.1 hypothetical protein [Herminiimonas contaminans]
MIKKETIKPAIAFVNQKKAESNIIAKIDALEFLLVEALGLEAIQTPVGTLPRANGVYCDFPKTIRQFNFWDSDSADNYPNLTIAKVSKNANETLKKHRVLHRRTAVVITKLNEHCVHLGKRTTSNPLRKLNEQLKESEALRKIIELELIECRRAIAQMNLDNDRLRDQNIALQALARSNRDRLPHVKRTVGDATGNKGK